MLTPRPYQQKTIDQFQKQQGLIVADECGLGKTLIAVEAPSSAPVLVVCPSTAIDQWVSTIMGQYSMAKIFIPSFISYDYRLLLRENKLQWVIISWKQLVHRSSFSLYQIAWPLVIADEAHRAKNRGTKSATNLKKLPSVQRLALTATPYEKREQVWSLLNWVAPDEFPSYWGFIAKYFVQKQNFMGWMEIVGPKDEQELARVEAKWMVRRTKAEVAPDLPPKVIIEVPLTMEDDQKKVYDSIAKAKDAIVVVGDQELTILNALSLLLKLQQVSSYPTMLNIPVEGIKMKWVAEFLDDHPDLRIIFFTEFVPTAIYLSELLRCQCLAGGRGTVQPFKQGYDKYLVMTIASGGESLDLGMADAAVFVETDWSSTKMTQAMDRIHRMNITSTKFVYLLSASKTDRFIMECADKKMSEREIALEYVSKISQE